MNYNAYQRGYHFAEKILLWYPHITNEMFCKFVDQVTIPIDLQNETAAIVDFKEGMVTCYDRFLVQFHKGEIITMSARTPRQSKSDHHDTEASVPASDVGLEEMEQERLQQKPSRRALREEKPAAPTRNGRNVFFNEVSFTGYMGQAFGDNDMAFDYNTSANSERLNGQLSMRQANGSYMRFGVTIFYKEGQNDELFDFAERLPAKTCVDVVGSMSMYVSQKTQKDVYSIVVSRMNKHVFSEDQEN